MDEELSVISDFYKGRDVFITGASGFMGKVLVEKLLRSCPKIRTIYVLLREKKGQQVKERLKHIFKIEVFDRVREEQPDAFTKVVALSGDVESADLGLSSEDKELLISNASVVFHVAANVKFDDHLRTSVKQNVMGTKHVIGVLKKMQHLEAFIHVSTAYSNGNREEIEEILYPPFFPAEYILDTVTVMDDDLLETITPKLLSGRTNTYTFTKALAESLIQQECADFPVAVIRPSIILASWQEPFPGWIDNINGPTGIYYAIGKGILRTMLIEKEKVAEYIPVDVVINLMIAVAWYTAVKRPSKIGVYNCTSGAVNQLTWRTMEQISFPTLVDNPSSDTVRYPYYKSTGSHFLYTLKIIFEHYIPACIYDFICLLRGKKPKLVKLYNQIHRAIDVHYPFTTREWNFHCENMFSVMKHMSTYDKKVFNFDISTLEWPLYLKNYILGIRRHLMKEDISTLPKARKSLQRLYLKTQLLNLAAIVGFFYLFVQQSSTVRGFVFYVVNIAVNCASWFPSFHWLLETKENHL